ncbi:MAG: S-layer homology domain-containing protein, partial [Clostridia bacterium]|nr:S-layer homology domain-containing protein [Clostridia bacterium]
TRAELAVVFARYFAGREIYLADAPLTDSFTDGSKIAKWARDAVETIRLCGIIAGDKAGNFNPSSSATRAEIAMMITRYLSAQKLSKSDWIMAHVYDYLPMSGRYAELEFSKASGITSAGFTERMLPYFGLSEDRYEIIVDEDELAALRDEWVNYAYGDKVVSILNMSLRDKTTGETSSSRTVQFMLSKIQVHEYVDPENFDPGIDPEIYSEMLRMSVVNKRNTARLYLALEKGIATGSLTAAYIGGSITEGASAGEDACYARVSANWLELHVAPTHYDGCVVQSLNYVNAGISGTDSALGCARFERDVLSKDPDIVFIEYACNDDPGNQVVRESFESMTRTALSAENGPAVVFVYSYPGYGNIPFMDTVAEKYGIPVVDVSAAITYGIEQGEFTMNDFCSDGVHPDEWGSHMMSDMIVEMFKTALTDWSGVDQAEAAITVVPEDTLTGARFEHMTLVDAEYLDVVSMGSFRFNKKDEGYGFAHPATAKPKDGKEPFVFIVKGKIVSLIIRSGTAVQISVDGGEPQIVGSGSYFADTVPVVISDTETTHTISVTPFLDDADAVLLGVAYK